MQAPFRIIDRRRMVREKGENHRRRHMEDDYEEDEEEREYIVRGRWEWTVKRRRKTKGKRKTHKNMLQFY